MTERGGMPGRGEMVGRGGMGRGIGRGRGGWGMEQIVGGTSTQRQQNEVGGKKEIREGENLEFKVVERGWWWNHPNEENGGDKGSGSTPKALGGETRWEDTTVDGITGAIGGGGSPGTAVVKCAEEKDVEKTRREEEGEEALRKFVMKKCSIKNLLKTKMVSLIDDIENLNLSEDN